MIKIRCADGREFLPTEAKLVASVPKVRSKEIHQPAILGEFPVLVEQSGAYRMFTYSSKLVEVLSVGGDA